jgi:hypothetical protein
MTNRTTTVMHLITEDKATFYNGLSLEDNLISAIIYQYGNRARQMDFEYRDSIRREAKIETIHSKNGTIKSYSPSYDMIAYTK